MSEFKIYRVEYDLGANCIDILGDSGIYVDLNNFLKNNGFKVVTFTKVNEFDAVILEKVEQLPNFGTYYGPFHGDIRDIFPRK